MDISRMLQGNTLSLSDPTLLTRYFSFYDIVDCEDPKILAALARSEHSSVRASVVVNPFTDINSLIFLMSDTSPEVTFAFRSLPQCNVSETVLNALLNTWSYGQSIATILHLSRSTVVPSKILRKILHRNRRNFKDSSTIAETTKDKSIVHDLLKDSSMTVVMAALKNPLTTESTRVKWLHDNNVDKASKGYLEIEILLVSLGLPEINLKSLLLRGNPYINGSVARSDRLTLTLERNLLDNLSNPVRWGLLNNPLTSKETMMQLLDHLSMDDYCVLERIVQKPVFPLLQRAGLARDTRSIRVRRSFVNSLDVNELLFLSTSADKGITRLVSSHLARIAIS